MRLALIPPIELLDTTARTDMQLMLPHLIESDAYTYTYKKHCDDPDQFVILDNGEAEGERIGIDNLLDIAIDFGVDELVLPDVIMDADETQLKSATALNWIKRRFETDGVAWDFSFMFVAQGKSYKEFIESAFWAASNSQIQTIGLPRHMIKTCNDPEARISLADTLQLSGKAVHLLGGSPYYPNELDDYVWPSCVRSTDTSAPFNYAYADRYLAELQSGESYVKRPEMYFDLPVEQFDEDMTKQNIDQLIRWTQA